MLSSPARVLLIHITGQDKPGLTRSLMRILADYGVRILDIGQAVIHDALALGILIELSDDIKSSSLLTNFLLAAHELNMQVRFTAVSDAEYDGWVHSQKKRRFIATVLGRTITASDLANVTGVVAGAGMNIDRIDRLSVRTPLVPQDNSRACIEFLLSGQDADEDHVRSEFMRLTREHEVDIAFQHDNVYRRTRRVVAFDMDSTLIQVEVIDELAKVAGVGEQVVEPYDLALLDPAPQSVPGAV